MADSTLGQIRTKIRRLTRSPSQAQLSTDNIDEYVNTFIAYDMPEHLRLFSLRTTFRFYTEPNIDTYETSDDVDDPMYDFKDIYTSIHSPVYIAGNLGTLAQSRKEFYGDYPQVKKLETIGTGDGVTTLFVGTLQAVPFLRGEVLLSSVSTAGDTQAVTDDGAGALDGDGVGVINYITGTYTINFTVAPEDDEPIYAQTWPFTAAKPQTILYYDNKIIVRPVPDKVYDISVEAYVRPTQLLTAVSSPDLEQWWQYIAYGAAKKIFQDRMKDRKSVV